MTGTFFQLVETGFWVNMADGTGPYVRTAEGAFVLVSTSDATTQAAQLVAAQATNTQVGGVTETAPATDTASSGLNGRLQRIAQRLTSLIAQIPATLGIKTAAGSLSVVPASDAVTRQTALVAAVSTAMLPGGTTGNVTGSWVARTYTRTTFQHIVTGTGVGGCTITVQVSNDGTTPLPVPGGVSAFNFNSSTVSDGFDVDAPWLYARAVVSGASGTITSITSTMSA